MYTNDQMLPFDGVTQHNQIVLKTQIQLPANLQIVSRGKNLTLTEFWLGNIRASKDMLAQICSVNYATNKTVSSNCLIIPGTMTIEIYSSSFIEYHLLNKNFCIYE